jgi:hypothetical protein
MLRCGNCGRSLSGLPDDVLYLCPQCCLVWQLSGDALAPVALETSEQPKGTKCVHLPFWMVDADVEVSRRITRATESSTLLEGPRDFDPRFAGLEDGLPWKARETLLVPAFNTDRALSLGRQVSELRPVLNWSSECPDRLDGGCIDLEEALRVAPGVVLAAEVAKPGMLAFTSISVLPLHSKVAAVPFLPGKEGFSVAGTSLVLPYNSVADAHAILDLAGLN